MVFINTDTWQKTGVEVRILDKIKWLNEKHIEQQLDHSCLRNISLQHPEYLRKQRQELLKQCGKQPCRRFLRDDFGIQVIMDCRTVTEVNFKSKLGFKQQHPIMTQGQSVLTKIKSVFSTEEIIFQHSVLGYRIDAYLPLKENLIINLSELTQQKKTLVFLMKFVKYSITLLSRVKN